MSHKFIISSHFLIHKGNLFFLPDIFIPIVLTCHKRITTAKVGTDMGGQTFPSVLYFKHKAESKANIKLNTDRKNQQGIPWRKKQAKSRTT